MPGLAVRDCLLRRLQMALLQGQHFPRQLFGFVLAGETRNAQQLIGHARHGRDDDDRKRLLRPVIRVRHNMRHAPHTLPAANRRSPEFQNTQSSFHKHHLTIFYNNEWISPIGHPQEGMAPAAVPSDRPRPGRPRPPARGWPLQRYLQAAPGQAAPGHPQGVALLYTTAPQASGPPLIGVNLSPCERQPGHPQGVACGSLKLTPMGPPLWPGCTHHLRYALVGSPTATVDALRAWSRSSIRSSTVSRPMERRMKSGVTPVSYCSSGVSCEWVVLAGWMISDLASPTLARWEKSSTLRINCLPASSPPLMPKPRIAPYPFV